MVSLGPYDYIQDFILQLSSLAQCLSASENGNSSHTSLLDDWHSFHCAVTLKNSRKQMCVFFFFFFFFCILARVRLYIWSFSRANTKCFLLEAQCLLSGSSLLAQVSISRESSGKSPESLFFRNLWLSHKTFPFVLAQFSFVFISTQD